MIASVLENEIRSHADATELPSHSVVHAHEADTPPTPGDTSEMLFARYMRTRDPRIRDRLVLCHEKLVRHLASRFANRMESIDDLIQVGNIGLIKAIDRFEPSRHLKFATYAVPTIVGEIQRHLRDKTWSISVARPLKELYVSATRVKADLTGRLGRVPTIGEVAAELRISEDELLRAMDLDLIRYTVSFGNPLQLDYDASHLTLSSALGETDESLGEVYTHVDLDQAIAGLEPNERAIIIGSYFKGMTQADIGKRLKVSQMQVSRLHRKALMRLKARLSAEP
jgi:RNA polymerase sigma-B factor